MALDEPKDNDTTFNEGGLRFVVATELLATCGTIKVDFMDAGHRSGFAVTSSQPLGSGSSCSSGSCSTGGCSR